MRRHRATLVAVFIFAGAALIASCAKPYHEEVERYVFVATNINLPYWKEAEAGFLDAAKTLGVKGELIGPTTYDPSAEVGMFRKIVEQQPAGICLSAARPSGSVSGTRFAVAGSLWPALFPPSPPPPVARRCSGTSPVLQGCPTSQVRSSSAYVLGLPDASRGNCCPGRTWDLPVPARGVSVRARGL